MTTQDRFTRQGALRLAEARARSGLSLREVARRGGTSHATLHAYENGSKIPSVATFLRLLDACGYSVDIELSPRVRWQDGIDRGEELVQVLRLAESFPGRIERHMNHPMFGSPHGRSA